MLLIQLKIQRLFIRDVSVKNENRVIVEEIVKSI